MKKMLLGTFYLLQGLGNVILAVFFVHADVSYGGSGGVAYGLEIIWKGFLVCASLFSMAAAAALLFENKKWALILGTLSSTVFGSFYALITLLAYSAISGQNNDNAATLLLASSLIVVLNVISALFLNLGSKGKINTHETTEQT